MYARGTVLTACRAGRSARELSWKLNLRPRVVDHTGADITRTSVTSSQPYTSKLGEIFSHRRLFTRNDCYDDDNENDEDDYDDTRDDFYTLLNMAYRKLFHRRSGYSVNELQRN